jgi:hypothetical protein
MSWHDFKQSTVRIGLYRVREPSVCAIGPRMPPQVRR